MGFQAVMGGRVLRRGEAVKRAVRPELIVRCSKLSISGLRSPTRSETRRTATATTSSIPAPDR